MELTPEEKALKFQRMMQEKNFNQNQLAITVGVSSARFNQLLNLLKLPEDQQKFILKNGKEQLITEKSLRK